jgi:hypothetical protein
MIGECDRTKSVEGAAVALLAALPAATAPVEIAAAVMNAKAAAKTDLNNQRTADIVSNPDLE